MWYNPDTGCIGHHHLALVKLAMASGPGVSFSVVGILFALVKRAVSATIVFNFNGRNDTSYKIIGRNHRCSSQVAPISANDIASNNTGTSACSTIDSGSTGTIDSETITGTSDGTSDRSNAPTLCQVHLVHYVHHLHAVHAPGAAHGACTCT